MRWELLRFTLFSSVQSLSCVRLFATSWTAAHQASLSITNSWSPPNPCSLSRWCHPTISSSLVPFSNEGSALGFLTPSPDNGTWLFTNSCHTLDLIGFSGQSCSTGEDTEALGDWVVCSHPTGSEQQCWDLNPRLLAVGSLLIYFAHSSLYLLIPSPYCAPPPSSPHSSH